MREFLVAPELEVQQLQSDASVKETHAPNAGKTTRISPILHELPPGNTLIRIKDADFSWDAASPDAGASAKAQSRRPSSASPTLRGISLQLQPGRLHAVVGKVGTGKSSLIAALLGEMERVRGDVWQRAGVSVAYVKRRKFQKSKKLQKTAEIFACRCPRWPGSRTCPCATTSLSAAPLIRRGMREWWMRALCARTCNCCRRVMGPRLAKRSAENWEVKHTQKKINHLRHGGIEHCCLICQIASQTTLTWVYMSKQAWVQFHHPSIYFSRPRVSDLAS